MVRLQRRDGLGDGYVELRVPQRLLEFSGELYQRRPRA